MSAQWKMPLQWHDYDEKVSQGTEATEEKNVIQNRLDVYASQYILEQGSSKEAVFETKENVSSLCCDMQMCYL